MKKRLYNDVWGFGIRARNLVKRKGLMGPFEPILLKLAPRLIRPPSTEVEVTLPFGMRMAVPPGYPAARSFAAGLYEVDITRLFKGILKEGMTVLDVGANIGYYTLLASRLVGASGRVYAFEPDPKTYQYLLRNIEANSCRNVMPLMKAASDRTGSGYLVRDPESDEKNWLSTTPPSTAFIVVQTITLDDFFAKEGWPSIDFIKMDIEGGEKAALEGMMELNRRNPALQLILEWDVAYIRRAGGAVEALAATLCDLGFTKGYIIEQGLKSVSLSGAVPNTPGYYNLLLRK